MFEVYDWKMYRFHVTFMEKQGACGMKIIISPAKKMNTCVDFADAQGLPRFLDRTQQLLDHLKTLDHDALKKLLSCSDAITTLNEERYAKMDLRAQTMPALLAYQGIQYQYMAPDVFEEPYFAYVQRHLRILSGFYGILKPFDGVVPYRLEMQARLKGGHGENLYDFWGDLLYRDLVEDDDLILNLASAEYSRCITKYLTPPVRMVRCVFAQRQSDGSIREKGVYVKMARGEMVRYLAEHGVTRVEDVRRFDRQGYRYDAERSDECTYVFVNEEGKKQC